MRILFFLLIPFISYSQVGQRLKLRQLEQGTPGQTIVIDSLGNATYGSGGGDGNGLYSGNGTIPDLTMATIVGSDAFALGKRTDIVSPISEAANEDFGLHIIDQSINLFTKSVFADHAYLNLYEFGYAEFGFKNQGVHYQLVKLDSGELELLVGNASTSRKIEITPTYIAINGGPRILTGTGSPETVVSAPVGSQYMRTDGGAGTTFYVKESGTGNTGWIAK